jgi:hypothetical protein
VITPRTSRSRSSSATGLSRILPSEAEQELALDEAAVEVADCAIAAADKALASLRTIRDQATLVKEELEATPQQPPLIQVLQAETQLAQHAAGRSGSPLLGRRLHAVSTGEVPHNRR